MIVISIGPVLASVQASCWLVSTSKDSGLSPPVEGVWCVIPHRWCNQLNKYMYHKNHLKLMSACSSELFCFISLSNTL